MKTFGIVFATIGAAAVLFALTFVTSLVTGLTTSMITLMSGPVLDRLLGGKAR
ncbi:MAG: hypothetical protein NW201_13705 [Gemmatimonadales bacterium]|nr:hypothetical protein [Gemmatimonadales bacterium]